MEGLGDLGSRKSPVLGSPSYPTVGVSPAVVNTFTWSLAAYQWSVSRIGCPFSGYCIAFPSGFGSSVRHGKSFRAQCLFWYNDRRCLADMNAPVCMDPSCGTVAGRSLLSPAAQSVRKRQKLLHDTAAVCSINGNGSCSSKSVWSLNCGYLFSRLSVGLLVELMVTCVCSAVSEVVDFIFHASALCSGFQGGCMSCVLATGGAQH